MDFNIINSKTLIIPFLLSLNKTKLSVSFQNNYYNTSDLIIKNYTHLSFKLFESESDRRYKNFLGLSYKGIQFNSRHSINLNEMGLYSNEIDWPWNDNRMKNYLDFHIGLEFEKFIFSWHFTNILSENYLINSSGNIENLNMQYFTVKWKFDN